MESAEKLLADVVADFEVLRGGYEKVGILGEGTDGVTVAKLLGGYQDAARFRRTFLLLDALVRHRVSRIVLPSGPYRHVAVFGGTNVGKSTVVNILAQDCVATASPEGGYTRQAHVFASEPGSVFGENTFFFHGFECVDGGAPPGDEIRAYLRSQRAPSSLPGEIALWDTPDCDAVGSARYLDAVIEVVTTADLVVYVTSVEKYSVEHLVEWLFSLIEIGVPVIGCLNKTSKRDRAEVIRKQAEVIFPKMATALDLPTPRLLVVALKNLVESNDESDLWGPEHPEANQLRGAVVGALSTTDRVRASQDALDFILRRLGPALEPVRMEIHSRKDWLAAVDRALAAFKASYERDYLTSSTTVEPISRLSIEILALLDPDIKGLKRATQAVRWVTRWPSKLILGIGRHVYRLAFQRGIDARDVQIAPELKAYSDAHTDLLNTLGRRIREEREAPRHHPFWDCLDAEWQEQLERLASEFARQIEAHLERTEAEIKAAARDILDQLRKRPALLNLLRAARVSADVGGALIGMFLPHGVIVYDLVEEAIVVPVMMGATEAAAKAGIDAYVTQRQRQVIQRLKDEADRMAETLYRQPLRTIADRAMARAGALDVEREILDRLPSNLRRLRELLTTEHRR